MYLTNALRLVVLYNTLFHLNKLLYLYKYFWRLVMCNIQDQHGTSHLNKYTYEINPRVVLNLNIKNQTLPFKIFSEGVN